MGLNDEDIKKALEQHIHIANYVDSIYCENVEVALLQRMLALIDRLQAENKKLQAEIKGFDDFLKETDCSLKEIKDNAIKEFVERLKKEAVTKCDWDNCVDVEDIDRLVVEMVGGENA